MVNLRIQKRYVSMMIWSNEDEKRGGMWESLAGGVGGLGRNLKIECFGRSALDNSMAKEEDEP